MSDPLITGLIIFAGILALIVMIIMVLFLKLYIRAWASEATVPIKKLIGMKLRKVPPGLIVEGRIRLRKAGIDIETDQLEAHYLSGGDVINVSNAIIAADKANMRLTFKDAAAIDLAGRNIFEAVRTSVQPKVIDCPDPSQGGTPMLDAVAKDGIRLLVKARVTVRANLERLVFGATEETIIARVGQGIVSAIGSSVSYKDVLENPDSISRKVLESGLDAQTAFEIVSIDIADISVAGVSTVANVGALLETERAQADKKMRQAEAEGRKAMAIAQEQEMRARVEEMRARVVEAEAEVPLAMAQAFRDGNLGVMDAFRLKNIEADTDMRQAIAKEPEHKNDSDS
jgi:uncharacterized protein YqfA (UPF0365 family)